MAAERPLEGRLAVVTGILGQLGPVWARALEDAGARVVGLDVREGGDVDPGGRARYETRVADVTDRAALEAVAAELGPVDVLVNNAGIDQPPDAAASTWAIEDVPAADFEATLAVNLTGTFLATQAFGARMRDAGRGSIVNVGSLYATLAPDPSLYDHLDADPPFLKPPAYGASKAGVLALTRYFARLWGPAGVRVNAISPGGVLAGQDEEFLRKYCARVPMRRMAEPADLGGALVFLASDAGRYVTGQELRVDGGFSA
ncbi:MAG TPA: SDR family oxidoreductase [Solirubrobacteraceae bacterium]|jgi:NAD(P)-dependent dehydrogenase (short-subunit alcohol dehydrogenase family)|nr:SDR family oxidoreductase [Solirubrobacteraceae bacterium]